MSKSRIQDGSVIIEVTDNTEDDYVYLVVSKERYDEDAVQVKLRRSRARAIGALLSGS